MDHKTTTKKLLSIPIRIDKSKINIPPYYSSVLFVFDNEFLLMKFVNELDLVPIGSNVPVADLEIVEDPNVIWSNKNKGN